MTQKEYKALSDLEIVQEITMFHALVHAHLHRGHRRGMLPESVPKWRRN